MRKQFNDSDLTLIELALRIAREKYEKLATETPDTHPHIAAQFKRQAFEAEKLRDLFADYPTVTVDTGDDAEDYEYGSTYDPDRERFGSDHGL